MGHMANTSSRTLRLLSLLQTRRYWPGEELAGQLRVSPRMLRRDIDRLRELGYPIQAQRGVAGGYQLAAGTALPPLVVDDEEAVGALAKVVQVMPARLRRRVQALGAMTVPASWETMGGAGRAGADQEVLTTLALACRDTERTRFSYTAAGGQHSARHVEPHRLVLLSRRWYLVGYDLDRQGWRSYRLDRLASPNGTGIRFRTRELPAADAAAFVRAGIQSTRTGYDVEVLVEAPAETVRERIGRWAAVSEISATRCRVRMTADALEWPVLGLGMVGADFQVISPPELLDWLGDWGRRFSRAAFGPTVCGKRDEGRIAVMEHLSKKLINWASILEPNTREQALRTASMPFIWPHLALMPDAHLGKGATVGSVVPTLGAIMPACVGVDLGCGMLAVRTQFAREDLDGKSASCSSWTARSPPSGSHPTGVCSLARSVPATTSLRSASTSWTASGCSC